MILDPGFKPARATFGGRQVPVLLPQHYSFSYRSVMYWKDEYSSSHERGTKKIIVVLLYSLVDMVAFSLD